MEMHAAPNPDDWRTWPRDGVRIFPPADATPRQAMDGWMEFSAARWGVHPGSPERNRRNVIRVLKQIDGRYEQIRYARSTPRGLVDVRVYGGCRTR